MDPVLLNFQNPQLEAQFDLYLLNEGQWNDDKGFFWFITTGNVLSLLRMFFSDSADILLLAPQILGWVLLYAFILYRAKILGAYGVHWWRTWAVGASRVWIVASMCYVENRILSKKDANEISGIALAQGTWGNHAFQLLILAWGLRLKFRTHVAIQTAMVILMLTLDQGVICNTIGRPARNEIYGNILSTLDNLSRQILISMYSTMGYAREFEPEQAACQRIMWFVHMYWGLGLVSYGIWLLERQSRSVFLKTIAGDMAWSHTEIPSLEFNIVYTLSHHIPILFIGFALSWELSCLFTDLWISIGPKYGDIG